MVNHSRTQRRKIWLHEYLIVSDFIKVRSHFKSILCDSLNIPRDEHERWQLVSAKYARSWLHSWHEELILGRRIYREPDFLLFKMSSLRDDQRSSAELLTELPPSNVQDVILIEVEVRITKPALIQAMEYSYLGVQARQHLYRLSSEATLHYPLTSLVGLVMNIELIPYLSPRGMNLQLLHPEILQLIPRRIKNLYSINKPSFPSDSVIGTWQRALQETEINVCRHHLVDERWNQIERFLLMALYYFLGSDVMRRAVEQVERQRRETLEEMQDRLIEELRRNEEEYGQLVEVITETLPADVHKLLLHHRDPEAMSVILTGLTPAQLEHIPEEILIQLPDSVLERLPDSVLERLPDSVLERLPDSVLERLPDSVLERLPEDRLLHLIRDLWPKEKRERFIQQLLSSARSEE